MTRIEALEDAVMSTRGHILVEGDFNGKAIELGMPPTDPRGAEILKMASRTGLVFVNTRRTPTFRHIGCQGTILDVTFASDSFVPMV